METCKNVGFELWQARKAKGWTRGDASAVTKIRVGLLEAIESNDVQALPPNGYLRKHLRDYVRELGLDPQDIVTRYLGQFETLGVSSEPVAASPAVPRFGTHFIAPLRRVALIAILVLVGLFFFNPATRLIGTTHTDTAVTAAAPEKEVNASYGAVLETSRNIAISSRLTQ